MPGMASTCPHSTPPPVSNHNQSLVPPPQPFKPSTLKFNLSKVEILPGGETTPSNWVPIEDQTSLRFNVYASPDKFTLVHKQKGIEDEEVLAWNGSDVIAVRLLVEVSPEDPTQSIVTLTIQNREKTRVDMTLDLRTSSDYKQENLKHLQDQLKHYCTENRIPHKISMKRVPVLPLPGEVPITRPKTPPNYDPNDLDTFILYPERPQASTSNVAGKEKEKENGLNGLNGVRRKYGKKGTSKLGSKKEEEETEESDYKAEEDEEVQVSGKKKKQVKKEPKKVSKKGKEKGLVEVTTNGKGNAGKGSKKLEKGVKKPTTSTTVSKGAKGGKSGKKAREVKPGYVEETVTEDDTPEEEEDDSEDSTSTAKRKKSEPPVTTSPRGRLRRQSTIIKKVSYVEPGDLDVEAEEENDDNDESEDSERSDEDEEATDYENDSSIKGKRSKQSKSSRSRSTASLTPAMKRRRRATSSSQPPNRSRPRTVSPDPLLLPIASLSNAFQIGLSPEVHETINPLKRQVAAQETRLDALSSFVYSPNRIGAEEGEVGEGIEWSNGGIDLGEKERMKFLTSAYADMRAKMKVYAVEIQQLKDKGMRTMNGIDKGKGKAREEDDGDVEMDSQPTTQESISILQQRIDTLENSCSNLNEALGELRATTASTFARVEELGERNAQLEKDSKAGAEKTKKLEDELNQLKVIVNGLSGQSSINPQSIFGGNSGSFSNLYNGAASSSSHSQIGQNNFGGAQANDQVHSTSPFQQPFPLPTLPHNPGSSSPNGTTRSSKRIANAPDTELSRRRRAASVGAPRVQNDSPAPRTSARRGASRGRGGGRASTTSLPKGPSKTPRSSRSKTVDPTLARDPLSTDHTGPSTASLKRPPKQQAFPSRTIRTRLSAASEPAIPPYEPAPLAFPPAQSTSTAQRSHTMLTTEDEEIYGQLAESVDRMDSEEAVLFKLAQGMREELRDMEEDG